MVNRILQVMLTAVVEQLHHANGGMFCDECIEEIIPAKQRMLAIGNQQCRFNLAGIGVQFTTLMAEQRQHRRNAQFQQREKGNIQFSDVTQLYQRGFTRFNALTAQTTREVIRRLIQLPVTQLPLAVDDRDAVACGMTGQNVGQRQILPVAFFPIATGKLFRPAGEWNAHPRSLMQSKNVQHGRKFDARFAPLTQR